MKHEVLFYIRHPIKAVRTKRRQIQVSLEMAAPPVGSTIEGFPTLPIWEASALLHLADQEQKPQPKANPGGVQLEDWSPTDQKRLLKGEKPKGTPLHRNI